MFFHGCALTFIAKIKELVPDYYVDLNLAILALFGRNTLLVAMQYLCNKF